jgi:hypothetical protein
MHPLEERHRGVDHVDRDLRVGNAGVGLAGRRSHCRWEHGLERFPVRQRPDRRIGGDEVVQVCRAGAGQADDHDRRGDRDLEDRGIPLDQVLDEETAPKQAQHHRVVAHDAKR